MEHNFHHEANNVQDLAGKEAIAKLKALAENARICKDMHVYYLHNRGTNA